MKRKLLFLLIALVSAVTFTVFAACGNSSDENSNNSVLPEEQAENLAEITGITFDNYSCKYDTTKKTMLIDGVLPEGVSVIYKNNEATNAGTYTATATLSGKGFKTKVLTATLTINKADYNVSLSDQSVSFDDEFHLPEISGDLPNGTTASYYIDDTATTKGVCAIGNYAAKIVLNNPNYNDITLDCLFKIKVNAIKFAKKLVESFGNVPDPWSFLPDSFNPSYHTIDSAVSYDNFVNVSVIPVNGIGKQLNMVYGVLNKATTAIKYVNEVYKVMNAFETAYVSFLDSDPNNYYKSFNFEKGIVSASFEISGSQYVMSASVSGFSVNLFSDADGSGYGAKINLGNSNTLKYTVSENSLTLALNVLNSSATYIEFVRNDNGEITGYIHEAIDVMNKEATLASALLKVDETYTTIIGTKGDFVVPLYGNNRNCEVYSNSNGRLVGTEVRETLKPDSTTEYTTLWYNLYNINGINSIKKLDEKNGTNPDTIYINNKTDTIHTKLVGGLSLKTASRRFDIEFKTQYFYQLNQDGEYEKTTCEIPMIFIQEDNIDTFEADFADKNDITVSLDVSQSVKDAVKYGFHTLVSAYNEIRNTLTFDDIVSYCNA